MTHHSCFSHFILFRKMIAWGAYIALAPQNFFSRFGIGTAVKGGGLAVSAATAFFAKGLALNNLILGGKVLAGSNEDAASDGLIFFGGWVALLQMAKTAGAISGASLAPCIWFNAFMAVVAAKAAL